MGGPKSRWDDDELEFQFHLGRHSAAASPLGLLVGGCLWLSRSLSSCYWVLCLLLVTPSGSSFPLAQLTGMKLLLLLAMLSAQICFGTGRGSPSTSARPSH